LGDKVKHNLFLKQPTMLKAEKVILKQLDDPMSGLTEQKQSKRHRSKMPHCSDLLSPAEFQGRYLTGLDENSYFVNRIKDLEERERVKKEIREERQRLEEATGKDLSATSNFWKEFYVEIKSDGDTIFNRSNAHDCIRYSMLLENGYVAPNLSVSGSPQYRGAKYYAFTEEGQNRENISLQKIKDKARAELLGISDNKDLMVLIGQYLEGPKYTVKQDLDTLYTMLSNFIEDPKEKKNRDKFLKALTKDREEMQLRVIVDRAIRAKVIRFNNNYFQRGQITLGKSADEVLKKLSSPEFSNELLSIKEELDG
jgi:hypothetical protein